MGNTTDVEAKTVPAETKIEETPVEENGGGDKSEEVEEAKAAEEMATNAEEAAQEEEDEAVDTAEAAQEEEADDTERKRNTRKRKKDPQVREPKRPRKAAETFAPALVSNEGAQRKVTIIRGRGSRLGSIPNVRKSIESLPNTSEDLHMAHRLVFMVRGKPGKDDYKYRKDQLLAFSGFLTPFEEGENQDYRARIDAKAEAKTSVKAYKMSIQSLKDVCHVFDIDISSQSEGGITKDELVDLLLDFLGAPDVELTNANKETDKKRKASSLVQAKEEEDSIHVDEAEPKVSGEGRTEKVKEEEKEEEEKVREIELPSDKALRKWVRAYVACFNMETVTVRHALDTASEKFGVDVTSKKNRIKELLIEEY